MDITPHLHVGAPGSFKVCSDDKERVRCGKLRHLFIPGKTAALVSEFAVEDLPLSELQPWFLVPVLAVKDLPMGKTI